MACRRIALFVACFSLAACAATTQDVVPVGNGNYEIAGSSVTAFSSGGTEKVKLLKVANQYCEQQGKQVLMMGSNDTNGHIGSGAFVDGNGLSASGFRAGRRATADVVFRCQ